MKLYELTQQMNDFLAAVEAGEIPEEAIADTLEGLEMTLDDKLDECAAAYKAMIAEANEIKIEEDKLADRRRRKTANAKRFAAYIKANLEALYAGQKPKKWETARNVITFRQTSSVSVYDEDAVIAACKSAESLRDCLVYKNPTVSLNALRTKMQGGEEVPGARIETGYSMTIK